MAGGGGDLLRHGLTTGGRSLVIRSGREQRGVPLSASSGATTTRPESLVPPDFCRNGELLHPPFQLQDRLHRPAHDNKVLSNGGPPILLEPVKATVTSANRLIAAVKVLDHDSSRTGRTLSVKDDRFTRDGTKDKAIYYELVFR